MSSDKASGCIPMQPCTIHEVMFCLLSARRLKEKEISRSDLSCKNFIRLTSTLVITSGDMEGTALKW